MAKTQDLEGVLRGLQKAADRNGDKVSVGELLETFGHRSFGPLLLLCGLLGMTPVSAIPTAPTLIAVITLLISVQLLLGRDAVWVPRFIEKLSIDAARLKKAVEISRKPARVVDRVVRPRFEQLTTPHADRLVALVCVLIALAVPPLEFLPFVAFIPSLAIFFIGMGLVARDGLVIAIALLISSGALGVIAWQILR